MPPETIPILRVIASIDARHRRAAKRGAAASYRNNRGLSFMTAYMTFFPQESAELIRLTNKDLVLTD